VKCAGQNQKINSVSAAIYKNISKKANDTGARKIVIHGFVYAILRSVA